MAAKNSKPVEYVELSGTINVLKKIPKGKTLIDNDKLKQLEKDNRRIGVLNIHAVFNESLEMSLILRFSKEDEKVEKLMGNISMVRKAGLAYALGIIDETALNDFAQIHDIRGRFAHSSNTGFTDKKVLKFVRKLSTAKGKKVTGKNSFKCFQSAMAKCIKCLNDAFQQGIYRLAAIESLKEREAKGD